MCAECASMGILTCLDKTIFHHLLEGTTKMAIIADFGIDADADIALAHPGVSRVPHTEKTPWD